MLLEAFVMFDVVLRVLMYINLPIELKFFQSQVVSWKTNLILNETLFQIEMQKYAKNIP